MPTLRDLLEIVYMTWIQEKYKIKKLYIYIYIYIYISFNTLTITTCPGYDVKLHLVARYQLWNSGECGVPLHCHYSQVHSDPEW